MSELRRYYYDGPILDFGVCVADHWKGETTAPSEQKARSNLKYQYTKQNNKLPTAKIELPGKLKII